MRNHPTYSNSVRNGGSVWPCASGLPGQSGAREYVSLSARFSDRQSARRYWGSAKSALASVILLCCLISTVRMSAQETLALTTKADSLREAGDLPGAIAVYRQGYELDAADFTNTYNLACSYALLNNRDSAFYFLEEALPADSTVLMLRDPDLVYLYEDPRYQELAEKQIQKVEAVHGPYENLELARRLWRMFQTDQAFYYQAQLASEEMGRMNPLSPALWHLKHRINEQNQEELVAVIEKQGWPKRSAVGGTAASAAFLVIQHADYELQKRFLPMIEAACEAEEASWSSYALMYDRIQVREDKPQKYGSQVRFNSEKDSYEPFPILEPEYVNQRRAEVGLGPLEAYLERWDIEWDVAQKEK